VHRCIDIGGHKVGSGIFNVKSCTVYGNKPKAKDQNSSRVAVVLATPERIFISQQRTILK
jgi:hypothetical protein